MSAAFSLAAGTLYMGGQPIGRIIPAEIQAPDRPAEIFVLKPVSISFKVQRLWLHPNLKQILFPPHGPKYRVPLRMCETRRVSPRRSFGK